MKFYLKSTLPQMIDDEALASKPTLSSIYNYTNTLIKFLTNYKSNLYNEIHLMQNELSFELAGRLKDTTFDDIAQFPLYFTNLLLFKYNLVIIKEYETSDI